MFHESRPGQGMPNPGRPEMPSDSKSEKMNSCFVGFNVNELKLQSLFTSIVHVVQANVSTWLSCVIATFGPQAFAQDLYNKEESSSCD